MAEDKKNINYSELLKSCGLRPIKKRVHILEILGKSRSPLTAQEICDILNRSNQTNRVTVYRILEILLEKGLVEQISGRDRSFRYGLSEKCGMIPHPHFYCTGCGNMECLKPESIRLDMARLLRSFGGTVENVEVRVDGLCKNCLKDR